MYKDSGWERLKYKFGDIAYNKGYQAYLREENIEFVVTIFKDDKDSKDNTVPILETKIPIIVEAEDIYDYLKITEGFDINALES